MQHFCYTSPMATKNPRIHAVLEPPLFEVVRRLARRNGTSLSQEAHDLIREAVELHEDRVLEGVADSRRATWNRRKALTAAEIRARLGKR